MLNTLSTKGYLSRTDMAYRGVGGESRSADLATDLTQGIVLTYGEKILPAYFTNTCGGHTVAVEKVFAMEPTAPLRGVKCDWCRESPSYEWAAEMPAVQIAERLKDARLSTVNSIKTEGAEPDGYARFVVINGEVRLGGHAFALTMGSETVKSACFSVTEREGQFLFEGHGSGHGVGMCQWGARGLAEAGRGWMDVLLHYYPGAVLQKAY